MCKFMEFVFLIQLLRNNFCKVRSKSIKKILINDVIYDNYSYLNLSCYFEKLYNGFIILLKVKRMFIVYFYIDSKVVC